MFVFRIFARGKGRHLVESPFYSHEVKENVASILPKLSAIFSSLFLCINQSIKGHGWKLTWHVNKCGYFFYQNFNLFIHVKITFPIAKCADVSDELTSIKIVTDCTSTKKLPKLSRKELHGHRNRNTNKILCITKKH